MAQERDNRAGDATRKRLMASSAKIARLRAAGVPREQAQIRQAPASLALRPLFNPWGGYAHYTVPPVLLLVLEQTLLIGVGFLGVASRPRTPVVETRGRTLSRLLGKTMAYLSLYMPAGGVGRLLGQGLPGQPEGRVRGAGQGEGRIPAAAGFSPDEPLATPARSGLFPDGAIRRALALPSGPAGGDQGGGRAAESERQGAGHDMLAAKPSTHRVAMGAASWPSPRRRAWSNATRSEKKASISSRRDRRPAGSRRAASLISRSILAR